MNYADAKALADCVVNLLAPHCQRIDIAGSIRRKMSDIGDIDIVCEPGDGFDAYLDSLVPEVLALDMSAKTGKPTANGLRQKSFRVGDTKIELWIVRPDRDYVPTLVLRTGDAECNRMLVTINDWKTNVGNRGLLPDDLFWLDGAIYRAAYPLAERPVKKVPFGAYALHPPTEAAFFGLFGLPYIPPERRTPYHYNAERGRALLPPLPQGHALHLHTAHISTRDPDALDITVGRIAKGNFSWRTALLAPDPDKLKRFQAGQMTEAAYSDAYLQLLRWRYTHAPLLFHDLITRTERLTLTCYCKPYAFCHRQIAVRALQKIGGYVGVTVVDEGELESVGEGDEGEPLVQGKLL